MAAIHYNSLDCLPLSHQADAGQLIRVGGRVRFRVFLANDRPEECTARRGLGELDDAFVLRL